MQLTFHPERAPVEVTITARREAIHRDDARRFLVDFDAVDAGVRARDAVEVDGGADELQRQGVARDVRALGGASARRGVRRPARARVRHARVRCRDRRVRNPLTAAGCRVRRERLRERMSCWDGATR